MPSPVPRCSAPAQAQTNAPRGNRVTEPAYDGTPLSLYTNPPPAYNVRTNGIETGSGWVLAMPQTEPTKIVIRLQSEGDYLEVRAEAPGGEGKISGRLPPADLIDQLAGYDPAHLPGAMQLKVGRSLHDVLAAGEIEALLFDTLQDAGQNREVVQIELRFDPDQVSLTSYPWELLCNKRGQFLVRDGLIDLTRYITYPQHPPKFSGNLRNLPLLQIVAAPRTLPPITTSLITAHSLVKLTPATFEEFSKKLLIDRISLWALQFDGHGALVKICPKCEVANPTANLACGNCRTSLKDAELCGALAFEDVSGVKWIPTSEFGSLMYNANVPMAVLLACDSAQTGGDLVFSGVAPGLLLAGVPAVIGMQYPVSDGFANNFANAFYTMLDSGKDLLEALRTARRMNITEAWYSPVLYLRYRRSEAEAALRPITQTRTIDTAVPGEVKVGADFFARLWIRRPATRPLNEAQLRKELGLSVDAAVDARAASIDVNLKPVEDRKLRRGEVEVMLRSPQCDITPFNIKLFVDEDLDAPPAIFTVHAREAGDIALVFTVMQDGVQIHSVVHPIKAVERQTVMAGLQRASSAVAVAGAPTLEATAPGVSTGRARNGGERAEPPADDALGMGAGADYAVDEEPSPAETVEHAWTPPPTEAEETKKHGALPPIPSGGMAEPPKPSPPPPTLEDTPTGRPTTSMAKPESAYEGASGRVRPAARAGSRIPAALAGAAATITTIAIGGAILLQSLGGMGAVVGAFHPETPVAIVTTLEPPATELVPTIPSVQPTLTPVVLSDEEKQQVIAAVFQFDRAYQGMLSTGETDIFKEVALNDAYEQGITYERELISKKCFWKYDDQGLEILDVFAGSQTFVVINADVNRNGVLYCSGEAQSEFTGPYKTGYAVEFIDGRWIVTQYYSPEPGQ